MFQTLDVRPMTFAGGLAGAIAAAWFFDGIVAIVIGLVVGGFIGAAMDRARRNS